MGHSKHVQCVPTKVSTFTLDLEAILESYNRVCVNTIQYEDKEDENNIQDDHFSFDSYKNAMMSWSDRILNSSNDNEFF